jgi:hypothetical protein
LKIVYGEPWEVSYAGLGIANSCEHMFAYLGPSRPAGLRVRYRLPVKPARWEVRRPLDQSALQDCADRAAVGNVPPRPGARCARPPWNHRRLQEGWLSGEKRLSQRYIDREYRGGAGMMLELFEYFAPGWIGSARLRELPPPP